MSQMGSSTRRVRASASSLGQSITAGLYGLKVSSNVRQKSVLCASVPKRMSPAAKDSWLESFIAEQEFTPPTSGSVVPRAQKVEEFNALAQPPLHHFRALEHLSYDGCDLRRAEIEFLIEILDRLEDLGVAQVRVIDRRNFLPLFRQKIDFL